MGNDNSQPQNSKDSDNKGATAHSEITNLITSGNESHQLSHTLLLVIIVIIVVILLIIIIKEIGHLLLKNLRKQIRREVVASQVNLNSV